MSIHVSDGSVELFLCRSMGTVELAGFEQHLLECDRCLNAVRARDRALDATRRSARPGPAQGLRNSPFEGAYHIVRAALAHDNVQDIGVLLRAEDDRLLALWRRDFDQFPGAHTRLLQQLTSELTDKARELGTRKCLNWLRSASARMLRMRPRRQVVIERAAAYTLNALYAEHIRPLVLPFRTHLPQYSLEAAAGRFGRQIAVEPEGWVEVRTDLPLQGDMFVAHVEGRSMEPLIPDGSLCVFQHGLRDPWNGKVQLVEQYGESGGSRYTVKLCRISRNADPTQPGDKSWLHQRVTLDSINPAYESWDVAADSRIRPLGEFLFVVGQTLKPGGDLA